MAGSSGHFRVRFRDTPAQEVTLYITSFDDDYGVEEPMYVTEGYVVYPNGHRIDWKGEDIDGWVDAWDESPRRTQVDQFRYDLWRNDDEPDTNVAIIPPDLKIHIPKGLEVGVRVKIKGSIDDDGINVAAIYTEKGWIYSQSQTNTLPTPEIIEFPLDSRLSKDFVPAASPSDTTDSDIRKIILTPSTGQLDMRPLLDRLTDANFANRVLSFIEKEFTLLMTSNNEAVSERLCNILWGLADNGYAAQAAQVLIGHVCFHARIGTSLISSAERLDKFLKRYPGETQNAIGQLLIAMNNTTYGIQKKELEEFIAGVRKETMGHGFFP